MDYKSKYFLLLLLVLSFPSCGKKKMASKSNPTTPVVNPNPVRTDELSRRCRIPVRYSNTAAHTAGLEALVQARVLKKERPTTLCLAAEDTPLKGFNGSLRVEYEDNYGLRWVTFRKNALIYSNQGNNTFRLLFQDQYGYVEVNATRNSAGKYTGVLRLANVSPMDTYLKEIEDFMNLIKQTCSQSPAKCLNPVFVPAQSNNQPPTESQILQKANQAFNGQYGADAFVLGTVEFDSSMIERVLF